MGFDRRDRHRYCEINTHSTSLRLWLLREGLQPCPADTPVVEQARARRVDANIVIDARLQRHTLPLLLAAAPYRLLGVRCFTEAGRFKNCGRTRCLEQGPDASIVEGEAAQAWTSHAANYRSRSRRFQSPHDGVF